jgi:hypothetical protein
MNLFRIMKQHSKTFIVLTASSILTGITIAIFLSDYLK